MVRARRSERDLLHEGERRLPTPEPTGGAHALLSLQRAVGNQAVQRLLAVQRSETDLTLDDSDFSPEQALELDKGFQLIGDEGDQGERTDGVDLESGVEVVGEELGGRPGEDIDPMKMRVGTKARPSKQGPLSKLKERLKGKAKQVRRRDPKGGGGWSFLSEVVGIPAGFEAAYQRGGAHEMLSAIFNQLAIGKQWVEDNRLKEAQTLVDGLHLDKLGKKQKLGTIMLSPILAARVAHIRALGKQLQKKIDKKKKLFGVDEIDKAKKTYRPEDLDTGEGLDGDQLGGF